MAIQHSVSQFLTRPWQRPKGNMLVYYDFETDRIEEAKAKDLFAQRDVHPKEIDERFQALIEDPLARLWHRVREEGVKPVTDWREIRAAHLIFLAQPARIIDHAQDAATDDRKLDDLLGKDDAYLDMLVGIHMQEYELRLFALSEGPALPGSSEASRACLFYPETGLVGFPLLEDPEKKALASITGGFGIPLHPQLLLTMLPKAVHEPWLAMTRGMFQAFSVGLTDSCRKIVIPATVADRYGHDELVTRIKAQRALTRDVLQQMGRMKELITQMHRIAGLVP
jgi:hypothetical protein